MRPDKATILDLLASIEIPPLKLDRIEPAKDSRDPFSRTRHDLVYQIRWENTTILFKTEVMTVANPKAVIHTIWRLRKDGSVSDGAEASGLYPLIVAPYLSEEAMKMLLDQKISGIDLSGNIQLIIPERLYFSRLGQQNRFPSNDSIKNVFRRSSSIVARVFFSRSRFASVSDLHFEIGIRGGAISLGTVSKVLKSLENELLISRDLGIRLADPEGLLQKLTDNFNIGDESRTVATVPNSAEAISRIAANCAKAKVLYCVDLPQRYALVSAGEPAIRIYVEDANIALHGIEQRTDAKPGGIEMIERQDPATYFDRRAEGKTQFASPVQSYLSLMKAGKPDESLAGQLRADLLTGAN